MLISDYLKFSYIFFPAKALIQKYSAITPTVFLRYQYILDKLVKENYFKYYVVIQYSDSGKLNFEIPSELKVEKSIEVQVDRHRKIIFHKCI